MTNPVLRQAMVCAERGWPVFPCQPGKKTPATRHGYLDATTDPDQVSEWFSHHPERNLAIATGTPGPDVLDVDQRGPAGNGYSALARLHATGLLDGAASWIRTPGGGMHIYFAGTDQRSGHLPASHIDFLAAGGYVLSPPSQVDGRPYQRVQALSGRGQLDWSAVTRLLEPVRDYQPPAPRQPHGERIGALARWVAAQPEGNRNAGLFWAANRALEDDQAADLSPLAAAARQAGLAEPEITRTLGSAHRTTTQATPEPPDYQAEGTS